MWSKFLLKFNALPSAVQIGIYSMVSGLLGLLAYDLTTSTFNPDWRKYAIIPVTAAINIVGWLILNKKSNAE